MRWNTPLSNEHAEILLERLDVSVATGLLDLGCGWAELLLRALERAPAAHGVGVDVDRDQLERGRRAAREGHLAPRVEFLEADASRCDRTADRVLCLGASHAWGGTEEALRRLRQTLSPGGRCLFGEGFWSRPPSREARELFGALSPSLSDLVKVATTWGWRAVYSDVASLEEWDAFETEYRHGLEEFARAHPEDPLAVAAGTRAEARRTEYEVVYRGSLGFAYLVLERVP